MARKLYHAKKQANVTRVTVAGCNAPKRNTEHILDEANHRVPITRWGFDQPHAIGGERTASLDDYNTNRQDYANRTKPELLNWGKWMSAPDLAKAGLSANRVTIPGDWDYAGVGAKL